MNRDPSEPRLKGAVYTPYEIAQALVKKALGTNDVNPSRVLEPGAGHGVFLKVLKESNVNEHDITAIDINEDAIANLFSNFPNAEIFSEDFLCYASKNFGITYDLIIGNPPYIKRRNFNETFVEEVRKLSKELSYPSMHLQNAWVAFILAASRLLNDDGTMAFVVPHELMTVNYGQYLQSVIFRKFTRVDIFIPDRKAFDSIEQDAVAFVATKSKCASGGIYVNRVKSLDKLDATSTHAVSHSTTRKFAIDLKSFLLDSDTVELLHRLRDKLDVIKDYCSSTPGIVTGANQFFILSEEDVINYKLMPWTHPILKKCSYLPSSLVFGESDFKALLGREPCFLIDFSNSNGNKLTTSAKKYIEFGESQGFNNGFKCRHRNPWYKIQNYSVPEGMFFKRCHIWPRICINEANVLITDTAYQIKMNSEYSIQGLCYSFYNSLTMLFAEIDGRFYGGGVLELTPSEFKNLPIAYQEPSEQEFAIFAKKILKSENFTDLPIQFGDRWMGQKLNLSDQDMKRIQEALRTTRNYRLRHTTPKVTD